MSDRTSTSRATLLASAVGLYFILSACAIYLWIKWDSIPQRFPIHWGTPGEPNGWGTKSFLGVYMMLIVGAVTSTFILLMALSVKNDRRVHGSESGAPNRGQGLDFMELVAIGTAYMAVVPMALFSVWLPFRGSEESPTFFILCTLAAATVLTAIGLIIAVKLKPYERNAQISAGEEPVVSIDYTQARHWKWGLFYYNPDDPALWVEKRLGAGPTPNMANRKSWRIVALLLAFLVFIVCCSIYMTYTGSPT